MQYVNPQNGPTSGGTWLSISGQLFGNSQGWVKFSSTVRDVAIAVVLMFRLLQPAANMTISSWGASFIYASTPGGCSYRNLLSGLLGTQSAGQATNGSATFVVHRLPDGDTSQVLSFHYDAPTMSSIRSVRPNSRAR